MGHRVQFLKFSINGAVNMRSLCESTVMLGGNTMVCCDLMKMDRFALCRVPWVLGWTTRDLRECRLKI